MSGFNTSPRVLFDTTVLCGAIHSPGINRQLLTFAAQTIDYRVVLSRVCLMEFYHNALFKGIGGKLYPLDLVDDFLELFVYPILDNQPAVNSRVGRHALDIVSRLGDTIGQALAEISECDTQTAVSIAQDHGLQKPLSNYDENDVHVWVTAINEECKYIVTSNTKRFPQNIGGIEVIKPGDFYNKILD